MKLKEAEKWYKEETGKQAGMSASSQEHNLCVYIEAHTQDFIEWLASKASKTSPNLDYAKCIEDLYENYPCKDEWDKDDIVNFLNKHLHNPITLYAMLEEAKMNLRSIEKQASVYFNETNDNAIVVHLGRMYYSNGFVMWLVNKIEAIQSTAYNWDLKQCQSCLNLMEQCDNCKNNYPNYYEQK